jgi:hypothetical protein
MVAHPQSPAHPPQRLRRPPPQTAPFNPGLNPPLAAPKPAPFGGLSNPFNCFPNHPAVSAKLKMPITADRMFKEVVKSAQDAAVLVLVY